MHFVNPHARHAGSLSRCTREFVGTPGGSLATDRLTGPVGANIESI